jgi:phosphoribosylamine-glycine ligase
MPDKNGVYPSASELLQYRDDTLHINCWATIRLLQIGPEAWVGAIDYQLAGEEPVPKALDFHCRRMDSRAAALLRESSDLIRACEAWEKANKRSVAANRKAVAALCKWAQGLVLGGSPAPLADPPKAAKKKAAK